MLHYIKKIYRKIFFLKKKKFLNEYKVKCLRPLNISQKIANQITFLSKNKKYDIVFGHDTASLEYCYYKKERGSFVIHDMVEFYDLADRTPNNIYHKFKENFRKEYNLFISTFYNKIYRGLDKIDLVCFVSPNFFYLLRNKLNLKKINLLRNLRNRKDFDIRKKEITLCKNRKNILITNFIYPQDNLILNLQFMSKLKKKYNFFYLGDLDVLNRVHKNLNKIIEEYKITNLKFFSKVDQIDLIAFLKNFDAMWIIRNGNSCRGLKYSLPNRVFEAYAANIPIIAMESCETINNFIRENNLGLIYKYNDFFSFEKQLEKLISHRFVNNFKLNVSRLKNILNWETESLFLKNIIKKKKIKKLSVVILAYKNLEDHDRLKRIVQLFNLFNCDIDVYCKKKPKKNLTIKGVNYFILN